MGEKEKPKVTVGLHKVKVKTTGGKYAVDLIGDLASRVGESVQFQKWLDKYDHEHMPIEYIFIKDVDWIDTGNLRVLFAKLHIKCRNAENDRDLPGIVFMRGDAVSIFMQVTVEETGETFVLLLKQPRVPIGKSQFIETTAGMVDGEKDVKITVMTEIFQETGLSVTREWLIHLGTMVPSAGGCDEHIEMYYVALKITQKMFETIQNRIHGLEQEHEQIQVLMLTPEQFVNDYLLSGEVEDAKILCCLTEMIIRYNPQLIVNMLYDFPPKDGPA